MVVSWYQVEARRPVKASEALPVGEGSSSPGEMCHEISPECSSNGFWPNSKDLVRC